MYGLRFGKSAMTLILRSHRPIEAHCGQGKTAGPELKLPVVLHTWVMYSYTHRFCTTWTGLHQRAEGHARSDNRAKDRGHQQAIWRLLERVLRIRNHHSRRCQLS